MSVLAQNEDEVLALFSTPQSGEGTYYGPSSSGSCTLDFNLPPVAQTSEIFSTVAMNSPQYYGSLTCGMCIQMTGEGVGSGADPIDGTFIVYVSDLCPECASGDLDVAQSGDGRWEIEWTAVDCPGNYGDLQYLGQGSNDFFLKVQVRNHRVPVSQLYLLDADGQSRITMTPTSDNFFTYQSSSSLSGSYTVQVESVDGQAVDDVVTIDQIISAQPFTGGNGVQFNGIAAGSPSQNPSPSPAASQSAVAQPSQSSAASQEASPSASRSNDAQPSSSSVPQSPSASRSPSSAVDQLSQSRTPLPDTPGFTTDVTTDFTTDSPSDYTTFSTPDVSPESSLSSGTTFTFPTFSSLTVSLSTGSSASMISSSVLLAVLASVLVL
uniref:Expansin-like EG45 domain-containing protein n=1 Tax=Vannella robusta TaxID=1487602 RepID=A0A7S4IRK7_9EUKA